MLGELRQLFNAIDPSPFHQRDLDPKAEELILGWAEDLPRDTPVALAVIVDRAGRAGPTATSSARRSASTSRAGRAAARRRLRELFRRGRISLAIGLAFLGASIAIGDAVANLAPASQLAGILRESFLIGGSVAMWSPSRSSSTTGGSDPLRVPPARSAGGDARSPRVRRRRFLERLAARLAGLRSRRLES